MKGNEEKDGRRDQRVINETASMPRTRKDQKRNSPERNAAVDAAKPSSFRSPVVSYSHRLELSCPSSRGLGYGHKRYPRETRIMHANWSFETVQ